MVVAESLFGCTFWTLTALLSVPWIVALMTTTTTTTTTRTTGRAEDSTEDNNKNNNNNNNNDDNNNNNNDNLCVVVVGGGMAGLAACSSLRKFDQTVQIVLVEPKDHVEIIWASYRSIFDKRTAERALFSLHQFCQDNDIHHVQQRVSQMHSHSAVLSNGNVLPFDVAFIAVGAKNHCAALGLNHLNHSTYDGHTSGTSNAEYTPSSTDRMAERQRQMNQEGEKLIGASSVLLVGGGIVGCELAGDLAHYRKQRLGRHDNLNVTLIHSGSSLCSRELGPSASRMVLQDLQDAGVRVLLNEKATIDPERDTTGLVSVTTSSGMVLKAEQVVVTTGQTPRNDFMDPSWSRTDQGWLDVDHSFRVRGAGGHVFAAGDCCTLLPNSASQILFNGYIFGLNMKRVLDVLRTTHSRGKHHNDQSLALVRLWTYLKCPEVYVVTTGVDRGVAQLLGLFATRWFVPWLKNKTMFFFRPRIALGIHNEHEWLFY